MLHVFIMRFTLCILILTIVLSFRGKVDDHVLTSPVNYSGYLFSESLIENITAHDVQVDYYVPGRTTPYGSFSVGPGHRVPLENDYRRDTEPSIDSPVLFFRTRSMDSIVLTFDGRHRVVHYPYSMPRNPAAKRLQPWIRRNLAWIGSWSRQRYRDPMDAKLIDGFRYQITDADYNYAVQ